MNYKKWQDHKFSTGCYTGEDYKQFQSDMRKDLRMQAKKNGLTLARFNGNHYDFSAVLQDIETGRYIYVSIPDVRFFKNEWYNGALYRLMANENDWSGKGGSNNYCEWKSIGKSASDLIKRAVNAA